MFLNLMLKDKNSDLYLVHTRNLYLTQIMLVHRLSGFTREIYIYFTFADENRKSVLYLFNFIDIFCRKQKLNQ